MVSMESLASGAKAMDEAGRGRCIGTAGAIFYVPKLSMVSMSLRGLKGLSK